MQYKIYALLALCVTTHKHEAKKAALQQSRTNWMHSSSVGLANESTNCSVKNQWGKYEGSMNKKQTGL